MRGGAPIALCSRPSRTRDGQRRRMPSVPAHPRASGRSEGSERTARRSRPPGTMCWCSVRDRCPDVSPTLRETRARILNSSGADVFAIGTLRAPATTNDEGLAGARTANPARSRPCMTSAYVTSASRRGGSHTTRSIVKPPESLELLRVHPVAAAHTPDGEWGYLALSDGEHAAQPELTGPRQAGVERVGSRRPVNGQLLHVTERMAGGEGGRSH